MHVALLDNCEQKSLSEVLDWITPSWVFCRLGKENLTYFFKFVTFWPIFWTPGFPNPKSTLLDSARRVCMQKIALEKVFPISRYWRQFFPQKWILPPKTVLLWFFLGNYQGQKWLPAKNNGGLLYITFDKNQRKMSKITKNCFLFFDFGADFKRCSCPVQNI